MNAVLVGYGEIGRAVAEAFGTAHRITPHDPGSGVHADDAHYDILLVAFGYSDSFVEDVLAYQERFGPSHTLVFSTVPIGTCRKLDAVHCPVEGKHPDLAQSLRMTDKWMGGHDAVCEQFLTDAGFIVRLLALPEYTEWLKLRSTTLYGVNIEFARYSKWVCDDLGLDYSAVKEWDAWVNGLYAGLGMPQFTRYLLDPPEGSKGGHCVTPNARILAQQYPDPLIDVVGEKR